MKSLFSLLLIILLPLTTFASLEDLVGPNLVNAKGEKVDLSSLEGKVIGLYFSAEWCPPCRSFTPSLVKLRDRKDDEFEVIFVSSDRSPEDQAKYMKGYGMKWPALPHDSEKRRSLGQQFGVSGIPALVIIDDQGKLITKDGRAEMGRTDTEARKALRTWKRSAGQPAGDDED